MLKVGLIGLGFMGRGHLDIYKKLEKESFPVRLVAVCDIDQKKLDGKFTEGNLDIADGKDKLERYNKYTDWKEMITREELDFVDIALPTYLHARVTIDSLNEGRNVLCEKPMALTGEECQSMIDSACKNNKKLMIAQCLRFWPEYEILYDYVKNRKLGEVNGAYFYRGGTTPRWSYENWLLDKEKSGGVLLDQHVHDVDMINWLFGKPEKVSTIGKNVITGSGYDIVSTNYFYLDKVVNAQDDWTLNGDYGFKMSFRVNFEKGNLIYNGEELEVNPNDDKGFVAETPDESGYYREIKYFVNSIINDTPLKTATTASTMDSILIARAEMESADNLGEFVEL